jgi:hypothetical protein
MSQTFAVASADKVMLELRGTLEFHENIQFQEASLQYHKITKKL